MTLKNNCDECNTTFSFKKTDIKTGIRQVTRCDCYHTSYNNSWFGTLCETTPGHYEWDDNEEYTYLKCPVCCSIVELTSKVIGKGTIRHVKEKRRRV